VAKVLLVDDDIAEISSVKRALLRAGHQPVLATNSADAMSAMAQDLPDLLIVSTTCENGEALALAARIDDDPATAGLPLLLLGVAEPMPAGARRLQRPLDPEQLLAEVTGALGPPAGLELESPEAPAAAPAPRAAAPAAKAKPARPVAPLVAAADAAGQAARAKTAQKGVREPPAGATALAVPLPSPDDAAASRRAAADALRARAEVLRKAAPRPAAPAPTPDAPAPAKATPAKTAPAKTAPAKTAPAKTAPARAAPAKQAPPKAAPPTPATAFLDPPDAPAPAARSARPSLAEALELEEEQLEAALQKSQAAKARDGAARPEADADEARRQAADDALRALEEEASSHAAEVARARRAAAQGAPAKEAAPPPWMDPERTARDAEADSARAASDERTLQEAIEAARRDAFEAAKRELEERARGEAAEAARLVQAEARARKEAVATAQREAQALEQQRAEAEDRARAEADARRAAEEQLQQLREQLEEERRRAEERVATVMQRAAQEEEAADELRRMAEDEIRRRDEEGARERSEEEDRLREAMASARTELETLRRKSADETRRRAAAESALQRLEEAQRAAAEREVAELARLPMGATAERFTPPAFFEPFDGAEETDLPPPDPAEDAARRRVAALRAPPQEPAEPGTSIDPIVFPPPPEEAPQPAPEPARAFAAPPAPLRAGELAELPIPRVLAMAAKAKLSGRLDFQGGVPRSVWFEDGRVVGASSADPSERVEEVALRLGLITREQHRQIAQATIALPSRRAALLLLERGFLKATELTGLVRRRTEEVVFGVFGDERGAFRWSGVEVPPEERAALERSALALAVEGVRRRWRGARVDALLGGSATLLAPVPSAPGPAELGLSPEERRAVALADGLRTLDEIVHASPLDPLTTRQVLAALVVTGALAVRVLHAGQPRAGASASIDLARVKDKLEQVRRADYFTVLGVGRLCTPHEVREAADRLQAEFEPGRFAGVADEGLQGRLAEIGQVIQDAREVLANDRLREEYLRGLGDAG
jgi:hypothetical protein